MTDQETNVIDRSMAPQWGIPLEEPQLALLGLISVSWAQFEMTVELALHFSNIAPLMLVDGPRDISVKLKNLKTYAETHAFKPALRKAIKNECDIGLSLALKRNLAIHGKWARSVDGKTSTAMSWFKVKEGEPLTAFSVDDLPNLATDIASATKSMYKCLLEANLVLQT